MAIVVVVVLNGAVRVLAGVPRGPVRGAPARRCCPRPPGSAETGSRCTVDARSWSRRPGAARGRRPGRRPTCGVDRAHGLSARRVPAHRRERSGAATTPATGSWPAPSSSRARARRPSSRHRHRHHPGRHLGARRHRRPAAEPADPPARPGRPGHRRHRARHRCRSSGSAGAGCSAWRRPKAFLFGVGVTVALVPEGMLPTVTLSLARGAQLMAGPTRWSGGSTRSRRSARPPSSAPTRPAR